MKNINTITLFVAMTLTALALPGCSEQDAPQPAAQPQPTDWKQGLDAETVEAMSQLTDETRPAALAQETCPVSDKALGSMGKPLMVTVDGRQVFLCCDGCEQDIKTEPGKYLSKLGQE